jgi:hypothetical protein
VDKQAGLDPSETKIINRYREKKITHPDSRKATFLSAFLKTQQSYLVGLDVKRNKTMT